MAKNSRVLVPGFTRKTKRGKVKVKGWTRKKRVVGKGKKPSKETYNVRVIRDNMGHVLGTKWKRVKIRSHARKTRKGKRRVKTHYRSLPVLYRSPKDPSKMSEKELEELHDIMFPKRESGKRRGLMPASRRDLLREENESILDQYNAALWAKDEEAISFLKPQVEEIRKSMGSGFVNRMMAGQNFRKKRKTKDPRSLFEWEAE